VTPAAPIAAAESSLSQVDWLPVAGFVRGLPPAALPKSSRPPWMFGLVAVVFAVEGWPADLLEGWPKAGRRAATAALADLQPVGSSSVWLQVVNFVNFVQREAEC